MGKTRDLFKKIRDTKGIFHSKVVKIKDRNGMDLTDVEVIKKRYTGMTLGDGMGREVRGGLRMGNTCTPMADSCQCMAKTTTIL